jgi:hypothetical protein
MARIADWIFIGYIKASHNKKLDFCGCENFSYYSSQVVAMKLQVLVSLFGFIPDMEIPPTPLKKGGFA